MFPTVLGSLERLSHDAAAAGQLLLTATGSSFRDPSTLPNCNQQFLCVLPVLALSVSFDVQRYAPFFASSKLAA